MTLQQAFCGRYQCPAAEFSDRVFRQCLYARAVPAAVLLRRLSPDFFRADRQLIQQVGLARNLEEVDAALKDFRYVNRERRHWLRTRFKVRLSGRKVRELAALLFARP